MWKPNQPGHCVFRNEVLLCQHCGAKQTIVLPIGTQELIKNIDCFTDDHKNCKPGGWAEPANKSAESQTELENALWWIENGHRGLSSESMWRALFDTVSGNENHILKKFSVNQRYNHPHDPDDFSRCYKLLQAVPQWRSKLSVVAKLTLEWQRLIAHWDQLTAMYEQNMNENWQNSEKIGMYQFMQAIINNKDLTPWLKTTK